MKYIFLIILSTVILTSHKTSADYSAHEYAGPFIDSMVKEHQFERQDVIRWLTEAKRQESIIKAMSRPAEKAKPWHEYRKIFVTDTRISRGKKFWLENKDTLERAEKEFGVKL